MLTLTTPALLFSAISLLLLAYTNRFLTLADRIRSLYRDYEVSGKIGLKKQIESLKKRVVLIKHMQGMGTFSFFTCVLSMLLIFAKQNELATIAFGTSLVFLLISLFVSLIEIHLSVNALNLLLNDLETSKKVNK